MQDQHPFTGLFEASSIAVVGASEREHSVGRILFRNLIESGDSGRLYPVNPRHDAIFGVPAYKTLGEIGAQVELAIVTTPPATIPDIVKQCGRCGIRHLLITTGFSGLDETGAKLERKTLKIARSLGIRILGPDSLGIMRPGMGLNATLTSENAGAGKLALVAQSAALCTAVINRANTRRIGFSSVISLGNAADIDAGEILDYLANDSKTQGILLAADNIGSPRRFIGALRSATRTKPVVLLKPGHSTDRLADAAFETAVRRAGGICVQTLDEWLDIADGLCTINPLPGPRLAIVSNDRGLSALAVDRACQRKVPLASFAPATLKALGAAVPSRHRQGNPIELFHHDTPYHFRKVIEALDADKDIDGLLVIASLTAMTPPLELAHALIDLAEKIVRPLIVCWMGGTRALDARQALIEQGIPTLSTPEAAIDLCANLATYPQNLARLRRIPPALVAGSPSPSEKADDARLLIDAVLTQGRSQFSAMEAKAVLRAFGVPVSPTLLARTPTEALFLAEQIGFPVVAKIDSPQLRHPHVAGGVRLNIANAVALRAAYHEILEHVGNQYPEAQINGISLEPFLDRPQRRELRVEVLDDRQFGALLRLGPAGADNRSPGRSAVALPPLNRLLARELIDDSGVSEWPENSGEAPSPGMTALEDLLLALSDLICETPSLKALELDPIIVDASGATAVDANIVMETALPSGQRALPLAIAPYPSHLTRTWTHTDGIVITLRAIRAEDAEQEQAFVRNLSDESKYYRFMDTPRELTPGLLVRFTQIDYDREMALVATIPEGRKERQIGVARYVPKADGETVEFALAVADDWQQRGIGRKLLTLLIEEARQKGYRSAVGDVLAMNTKMFRLVHALGFTTHPHPDDSTVKRVIRSLDG